MNTLYSIAQAAAWIVAVFAALYGMGGLAWMIYTDWPHDLEQPTAAEDDHD